jgi:folate-dependent phosphoribosylglycinamide formyltransferase PurN
MMIRDTNQNNRIAVAVSGRGRSLANLIKHQSEFAYHVVCVVTSKASCGATEIARQQGLPLFVLDAQSEASINSAAQEDQLYDFIREHRASWVALAGFLKKFPVRDEFNSRVVNIHPALLPSFGGKGMYGMNVHRAVLTSKAENTGVTVHFADAEYDRGPIISQSLVAVNKSDAVDVLADRVFQTECSLYPQVIHRLVTGKLPLPDGKIDWIGTDGSAKGRGKHRDQGHE